MKEKPEKKSTEEQLVRQFSSSKSSSSKPKIIILILVVGVLGIISGVLIAKGTAREPITSFEKIEAEDIEKGAKLGAGDTSIFKDTAEGTLREGGINGEGQYHLERPGGETQFVYLTSSLVDLSLLIDRKIKVWGETFASEKAGWLMDVGQVEVLD